MRAKGPIRVLVALLAVSLLPVVMVSAHHGPTVEDVVAEAVAQGMGCKPDIGQQFCSGSNAIQGYRSAVITPHTGPLAALATQAPAYASRIAPAYTMDASDLKWNDAMHTVGCANANAVAAFVAQVASLNSLGTAVGPTTVGECVMSGSLAVPSADFAPVYTITSRTLPSAFPTPTPTPTQKPTPTPTLKPTATPKPTGTPTTRPTATATATASESAIATATASAIGTPEQSVAGIVFTPEPSSAPPAPAGGGGADWAKSVPSANQVSIDPVKLAGSGLAALLLLLAMGFIGELFNNTFEANYDRILAGWQKSWLGRIGRAFSGLWGGGR